MEPYAPVLASVFAPVFPLAVAFIFLFILIFLDIFRKVNLMGFLPLTIFLPAAANPILLGTLFSSFAPEDLSPAARTVFLILGGMVILWLWLRLNILPVRDGKALGARLKIMIGGRFLCYAGLWAMALEILFLALAYPRISRMDLAFWGGGTGRLLLVNGLYAAGFILFLLFNGILRMFFTSRRLGVLRRVLMVATLWIPLVNLIVLGIACRRVYEEYDFACNKAGLESTPVDSDACKTRYPLLMVHGILFRDLRFFNYWGRIPRELIRRGAKIFYGEQQGVGPTARNAEEIRDRILFILKKTGAEKVNIIAHSKGGLDCRYAVSRLGMDKYTASLTTISTPHRGCRMVDAACRLPEGLYRWVAKIFDSLFRRLGDASPDFYTATRQFATTASAEFNSQTPDAPGVCYQSYMSRMKGPLSDPILTVPYLLTRAMEGANDGLVSLQSAAWGEYHKPLASSKGRRGISHGDIIDLKREDYKGFDVLGFYLKLVTDLKDRGF